MSCFNAGTVFVPGQGISCANCHARANLVNYDHDKVWECSRTRSYIAEYMAGYGVMPKEFGGKGMKRSRRLRR